MKYLGILLICVYCPTIFSLPTSSESLVVSSTEVNKEDTINEDDHQSVSAPLIDEMNINTNISNRFGKTLITSKVKNPSMIAQQATFSVILPENAYISEFVMEIGGKSYQAYVKEKEEAKQIYDQAVASGRSAAHVAVSARDSNRFTVSVNVEPEGKAVFLLTYEELLQRKNDKYEIVINIHPGQIVKHLGIDVNINESRPLKFVKTPDLRTGNEISKNGDGLAPNTNIEIIDGKSAKVTFNPDVDQQKDFAENLGTEKENGLSGQFIVEYDVERDPQGGEVLIKDGYFVHFFAPQDMEPMPKDVAFILDTSGSMYDGKLEQVKKAMESILSELNPSDVFTIIDFDDSVRIHDIDSGTNKEFRGEYPYQPLSKQLEKTDIPGATPANENNINKAKEIVNKLHTGGSTNIIGALEAGLYTVQNNSKYQPMVVFLTDGAPNVGLFSTERIVEEVTQQNSESKVPIYSLSFGNDADKDFLRKLSLKNLGFSRHIYHAADAHLQLQDFYHQISSPLLTDVTFEYVDPNVEQVTKKVYPIYFAGSEIVVAGRFHDIDIIDPGFSPSVWGNNIHTRIQLPTIKETPVGPLERLWAYLTIKQKLEDRASSENKTVLEKEALDLALKYSFVTPVSSLVVVKPNDTSSVDTEEASKTNVPHYVPGGGYGGHQFMRTGGGSPYSFSSLSARSRGAYPVTRYSGSSYQFAAPDSNLQYVPRGGYAALSSSIHRPIPASAYRPSYPTAIDADYDIASRRIHPVPTSRPYHIYTVTSHIPPPRHAVPISRHRLEDLKAKLPWLRRVLDSHGNLSINGTSYQLAIGHMVGSHPNCTNTPSDTEGSCQLLDQCTEIYHLLTDFTKYEHSFCSLEGFAGVCCPSS